MDHPFSPIYFLFFILERFWILIYLVTAILYHFYKIRDVRYKSEIKNDKNSMIGHFLLILIAPLVLCPIIMVIFSLGYILLLLLLVTAGM